VQSWIDGLGFLPAVDVSKLECKSRRDNNRAVQNTSVYLRESDRKAIKQIRQPRSQLFRYIWRPGRRALDVAGVEDVDGDASALRNDFSEEVHRVLLS
jgi:hypothetical protein